MLHPPLADPTQPYLSLPVLKGYLRSRGLDAGVLDLNIEAVHYLLHPETLDDLARRVGLRFLRLNRSGALSFDEQREYKALLEARPKIEGLLAADPPPVDVFRKRELFLDPAEYSLARRRVEALFDVLSAVHFPYRFGLQQVAHEILPWNMELLEEYAAEGRSPFGSLYRKLLRGPDGPADGSSAWEWEGEGWSPVGGAGRGSRCSYPVDLSGVEFIGISIVFPSQLAEAFHLVRLLRRIVPGAFLCLGGPFIHQVALRANQQALSRVLELVDAVGLFEGEETLAELLPCLSRWREAVDVGERFEILARLPNLLVRDPATGRSARGPHRVVSLEDAAPPDYSDLDLDRYLAPSRTILYAPTRGCYWKKCSFCQYGLTESGTAPYREVPPDRAVAQLARLSRRLGVRNVYISCDVLSPSYAVRFAEALIERGLKIRWSSDLKVDPFFTAERCEVLHRSGMRCAAFGMESGSDRVLELMQKGCRRETLTTVNRSFHAAGVATQWMTFTDHPGEMLDEALATVRWVASEGKFVDLFIVGEFGLEAGSDVARHPERYGVEAVYYAEGDELRCHALFTLKSGGLSDADRGKLEGAVRDLGTGYALRPYPWAGAVSTHHTFLHFLEFGQQVFRVHFQRAGAQNDAPLESPPPSHIAGLRERPRFSREAIVGRERRFLEEYLRGALAPRRRPEGGEQGGEREGELEGAVGGETVAALCREHWRAAARGVEELGPGRR